MKKTAGFTLIELIVTMVVAAILAMVAVPRFKDMIVNNRATAQANNFLTALTLARSEAVKRRETIRVTAVDSSAANNEWGPGWQVIEVSSGTLLRAFEAIDSDSTLDSVGNVATIDFDSAGMLSAPAAGQTFQLRSTDCTGDQGRDITLTVTGRASVARANCP
jgi:type IV fimbrial biogenesis protein FimT